MERPKVSVFLALSLDGFIAGPDGGLAWLDPYAKDNPQQTGYERLMQDIDTLVLGRNTYEKVLSFGFWPYSGKRASGLVQTRYRSPLSKTWHHHSGVAS